MENVRAASWVDPGFFVLETLLHLQGLGADVQRLRECIGGRSVGIAQMLEFAKDTGLKARVVTVTWEKLATAALPGIAALRDGSFLLIGKANGDSAIVVTPGATQPLLLSRADFEAQWDGRVLLIESPRGFIGRLLRMSRARVILAQRALDAAVARIRSVAVPPAKRQPAREGAPAVIDFADRARKLRSKAALLAPGAADRQAHELAFLPAALEIVETPPSPLGRAVAFSVMAIFAVGLTWACIGNVDIVAVAPGKLIPGDRTKVIQPFETGVVRSISVRDGQAVAAGDPLIELDSTMNAAEVGRISSDLLGARLDVARLKAALTRSEDPLAIFAPPEDAPASLVDMHRRFLNSTTAEQKAKLAAIDGQVAQKEAERATIGASIDKLKAVIAPLERKVDIRQQLVQKELGSTLTYLTELQELVGHRQEIVVQESRDREAVAAIASLVQSRQKAVSEHERALFDELAKAEQKAAGLAQDFIRAQQRTGLQKLTAPIAGVVQQLAIHTVGGVVTPAQTLMVIVPTDGRLEIEAMVSNRDIGFVEVGQEAAIKVDAFSFTRYGLLDGKVVTISHDAIARNRPPVKDGERAQGAETTSSEPNGQELVYAARVSLDRTHMDVESKRVNLAAGMAVSVEIKTGSRSIISYLLSPLTRYKQESFRER